MTQQWSIPLWLTLTLGWISAFAHAQDAEVQVTVNSNQVQQGSLVNLTVSFMNCSPEEAMPPNVKGLEFHSGPMTSTHRQWVNGVSSAEDKYTYRYVVRGTGEINVPAMVWSTNEGRLKSKPIRLLVQGKSQPRPQGQANRSVNKDLMTAIEPSKRTVYLGEPLVLSYKIYNRYNNLDVKTIDIPELEGFWKETIEDPEARWEPQVINGKRYNVATVRRIVAFPQQTGTFQLSDFNIVGFMRINFFDGREIAATCSPVSIEVLPYPDTAPAGSLGTFGQLVVDQRTSADSVATNEAVTIEVQYKGQGNLKFLQEPELVWPAEFEVFDAEVKDNIRVNGQGEQGSRTFKYLVIPRAPGLYTLPAMEARYFDPRTATHRTSQAPALKLAVTKGEGDAGTSMTFTHQQDVQVLNQDIRHIQLDPTDFIPIERSKWKSFRWMLGFGVGPLGYAWMLALARRHRMERRDPRGARKKKAMRALNLALNQAQGVADVGEAMEQYLMSKLGWERSSMTTQRLSDALKQSLPSLHSAWMALWNDCEIHRYGGGTGETESLAQRLRELVEQSESNWS